MKKILKITGVTILVMLLLLIITPFLFRDRIGKEVKNLANRTLKSELNFSDMSLSFFSHFPHLSLTLTNFSLKSSPPFSDTLISAGEVGFGVNVKSLFGKTIVINRVYLEKAKVNIRYNEQGAANYDVYQSGDTTKTAADTASSGAELNIESIRFIDCRVIYSDPSLPVEVVASRVNYSGSSKLSGDIFDLASEVKIDALDVVYDHTKYIDSKPVTAKLATRVNTRDLTVNFEKNDLKIKDIPLQFSGRFNFEKNGYQVNLNFLSVMEKEFMSARFKIRQSERLWLFAKVNASIDVARWARAFDLKTADVKGLYELNLLAEGPYITGPVTVTHGVRSETDTVIQSIPKFTLMTKFTGGYVKYAGMPQSLNDISFLLNAACPDNDYRHISVSLENLNASFLKNRISGWFRMKNLQDIPIEAQLTAGCNLAELKQVMPMDSLTLSGLLSLDVKVNGNYAPEKKKFPVTMAVISLTDGSVQTPWYPHPVDRIGMSVEVTNRTGSMNDLVVDVRPLSFEFEGKPFTITAHLERPDDLIYDVKSKGEIDLGKVYKVFSQQGMDLDGFIRTDFSLKGRQSDATAGRYDKLQNSGTLVLRDIAILSDMYPKPFIIKTGNFRFDQDNIRFDDFLATYGVSDFRLKGSVKNIINYILVKGSTLKGDFDLSSNLVNVDGFMAYASASSPSVSTTKSEDGVVIIPRDLDIDFKANIKKTLFEGLEILDLKGEIDLKEGILVLKNGGFSLIGCKVGMDATYGNVTPVKGFFDFHIKADDFDIKRAYNEVAMIREMAPSAGKAEGIVSLDYSVKGMLDATMFPVMRSLEGGGVFSIKKVKVYGLKLFNDIGKGTEKEGIKNPDISKVDIKSTIKDNTITLEQFKFKVKGIRVKISGATTFDRKLNLKIRLGLGPLGIIGIPMKIGGTMDDPKIKYGRGKDEEKLSDDDYSDTLPQEMLNRIKSAKEDAGDEEPESPVK